jgi:site-specific DNA-methyltransferase (adenine-specific)
LERIVPATAFNNLDIWPRLIARSAVPRKTKSPDAPSATRYSDSVEQVNPLQSVMRETSAPGSLHLAYEDRAHGIWVYQDNCLAALDAIAAEFPEGRFDMIFADPPYFLSNGGITCHAGKMVKVDKGDWDKSRGAELNHEFNTEWLKRCQKVLKPNGTIWVTGTQHVIFSVGYAMQQLDFKLLNDIAWEKPNPPPNLSCRYFTHSTETVIWAAKNAKSKHYFNYPLMRQINAGKQMKTVWRFSAPGGGEKKFGKHPTQKPVALVQRCILASTKEGDCLLDPFLGSGTTAVAARGVQRKCVGIELDAAHVRKAIDRLSAIGNGVASVAELSSTPADAQPSF